MKTFPLRLDEELHKKLKHASVDDGKPLHEWIIEVLKERVDGVAEKKPVYLAKGESRANSD